MALPNLPLVYRVCVDINPVRLGPETALLKKFHRDAVRIPYEFIIFVITDNNECWNKFLLFDTLRYTLCIVANGKGCSE
jgi:hypothetical protein